MEINIQALMRANIRQLTPYASARSEFTGTASVFLDANENAFTSIGTQEDYTRYPDPLQKAIKQRLADIEGILPEQIFIGNGSDEGIDLLMRIFCEPSKDKILVMPPTYGMYQVSADINDAAVVKVPLNQHFEIDLPAVKQAIEAHTPKLLFICSPNNPTGNLPQREAVLELLGMFNGIIVIDEAYIDYCPEHSFLGELTEYRNLVICRTFSKAWGLAALRLGITYAHPEVIAALNKVKAPYNVNAYSQKMALEALHNVTQKEKIVKQTLAAKAELIQDLSQIAEVEKIFPSDTNFVFFTIKGAAQIYQALLQQGIIIRNQTKVYPDALRITVGTPSENKALIKALAQVLVVS